MSLHFQIQIIPDGLFRMIYFNRATTDLNTSINIIRMLVTGKNQWAQVNGLSFHHNHYFFISAVDFALAAGVFIVLNCFQCFISIFTKAQNEKQSNKQFKN